MRFANLILVEFINLDDVWFYDHVAILTLYGLIDKLPHKPHGHKLLTTFVDVVLQTLPTIFSRVCMQTKIILTSLETIWQTLWFMSVYIGIDKFISKYWLRIMQWSAKLVRLAQYIVYLRVVTSPLQPVSQSSKIKTSCSPFGNGANERMQWRRTTFSSAFPGGCIS